MEFQPGYHLLWADRRDTRWGRWQREGAVPTHLPSSGGRSSLWRSGSKPVLVHPTNGGCFIQLFPSPDRSVVALPNPDLLSPTPCMPGGRRQRNSTKRVRPQETFRLDGLDDRYLCHFAGSRMLSAAGFHAIGRQQAAGGGRRAGSGRAALSRRPFLPSVPHKRFEHRLLNSFQPGLARAAAVFRRWRRGPAHRSRPILRTVCAPGLLRTHPGMSEREMERCPGARGPVLAPLGHCQRGNVCRLVARGPLAHGWPPARLISSHFQPVWRHVSSPNAQRSARTVRAASSGASARQLTTPRRFDTSSEVRRRIICNRSQRQSRVAVPAAHSASPHTAAGVHSPCECDCWPLGPCWPSWAWQPRPSMATLNTPRLGAASCCKPFQPVS